MNEEAIAHVRLQ